MDQEDTINKIRNQRYLYKLTRRKVANRDEYISAIVAAWNEDEARKIHPNGWCCDGEDVFNTWVQSNEVIVEKIGVAESNLSGVILSSFLPK